MEARQPTRDELRLSRARAQLAQGSHGVALELLLALEQSTDRNVALRAKIQLGLAYYHRNEPEAARTALDKVRSECTAQTPELRLELARAWARIEHPDCAGEQYRVLLRESPIDAVRTRQDPHKLHIAARSAYRLGHLVVGKSPDEALALWRRAFDANDENVSPYAAFALASRIGTKGLVPERVEELYRYAIHSNHPRLAAQAATELADYLRDRLQFEPAHKLLEVAAQLGDAAQREAAARRMYFLARQVRLGPEELRLRRPRHLRRAAHAAIAAAHAEEYRVVIVGAGTGGQYLLESLANRFAVCGFIDDFAQEVAGHPGYRVLGQIKDLEAVIRRFDPREVLMAIPTLPGEKRAAVVAACRVRRVPLRHLPAMHELRLGWTHQPSLMAQLRSVRIEEITGSRSSPVDWEASEWVQGERALVVGTGALGAEIARRLAHWRVKTLILMDRNYAALDALRVELADRHETQVHPVPGDATSRSCLDAEIALRRPTIVFNTSGSAHPDLLEMNAVEGARYEIFPAFHVAAAAGEAGVPKVVHVSSTRAAGPTGFFGAMKALSEAVVLSQGNEYPGTAYAVVRTGSLMDSSSSVLAEINQHIRLGATVKVPSPEASERFVATARAAELVLHATRLSRGGDLLALDTGEVLNVRQLAEEMIRMQGLVPEVDIPIEVGRRGTRHPTAPRPRGQPLPQNEEIVRVTPPRWDSHFVNQALGQLAEPVEGYDQVGTAACLIDLAQHLSDVPAGR
jgi:FlaA1/EpsC-like NDP-sugar epimerase